MSTNESLPAGLRIAPSIAVRPETFGALLYDYDTRRLSFIKDPRLADLVRTIADHDDANTAFQACSIAEGERQTYVEALKKLVSMGVLATDEVK